MPISLWSLFIARNLISIIRFHTFTFTTSAHRIRRNYYDIIIDCVKKNKNNLNPSLPFLKSDNHCRTPSNVRVHVSNALQYTYCTTLYYITIRAHYLAPYHNSPHLRLPVSLTHSPKTVPPFSPLIAIRFKARRMSHPPPYAIRPNKSLPLKSLHTVLYVLRARHP